jgi:hypothetical protein
MMSYSMLDENKDGTVSAAEWNRSADLATARLPAGPAAREYRCRLTKFFDSLDEDHDHRVSATEWKSAKFESGPDACS